MKKALINDWYNQNGGAEKVIHSLNSVWNDFDHFALVDTLKVDERDFILNGKHAKTSFIQNLPFAKKDHRKYLQFFPYAIEQFDLREYDLVISSSSSIAKGVLTNSSQLHICYCHSPIRYAWDLYHQYLEEGNLKSGIKGFYAKYVLHKMRNWDVLTANRPDYYIANSEYIAARIKKIYDKVATVIYPPVNTDYFILEENKEDYYFTASRMVPYKKMQLIVETFNRFPDKKLIVGGNGPDFKKIKKIAKENIILLGYVSQEDLKIYLQKAKVFIFAAEEDFGIAPVEAQACGTPVIAYGKGGSLETIINKKTGLFFEQQTIEALTEAINEFETLVFNPKTIRENALRFSKQRFEKEIKEFVEEKYTLFKLHNKL